LHVRYIEDKMRTFDFGGSRMGEREVPMSNLRRLAAVGAVLALALVGGGSASAATPQKIYRDLTDNGKLDGRYTRAEIDRAFNLAPVGRTDVRRPSLARKPIADNHAASAVEPTGRAPARRVPFSALDAALLVAGGGPLLLIGAGLRRRVAAEPRETPVASA
jgi:hypothetical protein